MWNLLRTDRWLQCALLLTAATVFVYLVPVLDPATFDFFDYNVSDPVFLTLMVVALGLGARGAAHAEERRFWGWLAAGYVCWLFASLFYILLPGVQETLAAGLISDFLFLAFYVTLILAVEAGPHLEPGWTHSHAIHRMESLGAALFLFGLLGYFVLIPSAVNFEAYDTWLPSIYMYIALDAFLMIRFAIASRRARSPRWRAILRMMAACAGVWVVADSIEGLLFAGRLSYDAYTRIALIGYVPFLVILLAVRLPDRDAAARPAFGHDNATLDETGPLGKMRGALVAYGFLFPLMHIALYAAGLLDEASRGPRGFLVLGALLVMGPLTLLQQVWLDRRNRSLQIDLRRANAELQRSLRLESLGRLAGGVAHDFNNLLTVIRGTSESIQLGPDASGRAERQLETIAKATEQAGALTRQLLALGSRQFLEPEVTDLNRILEDSRRIISGALGPGVRLATRLGERLPPVRVDPAQINQVLLNLALNARDAMPHGGTFSLETKRLVSADGDDRVGLVARDSGSGMDPETLDRVFDPFFTTKDGKGNGLGLSTAYGIVRQSEGEIRAASTPGRGTTFTIEFPAANGDAAETTARPGPVAKDKPEATVLVVDDDSDVRELIFDLLESDGYDVLSAADGRQALAICESHEGPIHLVLTDVVMPAMDGAELGERLKKVRPDTPVLYMSGYVDRPQARLRLAAETGGLIQKPFSAEQILDRVEVAILVDCAGS